MKLAVSYDDQGNILTLFDPATLHSKEGFLTYVPAPGEKHVQMEVPKELAGKPFTELHKLLRVDVKGQHPKLERRA